MGLGGRHDFLGRVGEAVGGDDRGATGGENLLPLLHFGALKTDHEGDGEADGLAGFDQRIGDRRATHDATEDVHQDRLDMRVAEDDSKSLGDLFDVGATADVEEVGRFAAMVFDEVHRAHCQTGTVDEAPDRAVEFDVRQASGRGPRFGRLLLLLVAEGCDSRVAEEGVVIERHLGVEGHHPTILGEDEGIDLEERGVEGHKSLSEGTKALLRGPPALRRQTEFGGQNPRLVRGQSAIWVERLGEDQFWRLGRHLLDIHATSGASDEHRRPRMAVDEDRTVELAIDLAAALHEHLPDDLPLGAGLDRDQRLVEQSLGDPGSVVGALCQLHPPLLRTDHHSLAAAAGVDLGLDGAHRGAERRECSGGFLGGPSHAASQHRHAGRPQQILRLVFVNLHAGPLVAVVSGRGCAFPGRWVLWHTLTGFPIQPPRTAALAEIRARWCSMSCGSYPARAAAAVTSRHRVWGSRR